METKKKQKNEIGMVGLGVMGRNLVLNMADHGFSVAGYDKDTKQVEALRHESKEHDVIGTTDIQEFIAQLRQPRAVMMLVPAGAPVDSVIKNLLPRLNKGDLIIDAGNSYFKDTDVRARNLAAKGIQFLGVGVSGGEEGARHGPEHHARPLQDMRSCRRRRAEAGRIDRGPGNATRFPKQRIRTLRQRTGSEKNATAAAQAVAKNRGEQFADQ